MLNRVILVGRLTRDPELRRTNSDIAVASFTVAVDNRTKSPEGEKTASFIPVTVWNQQADNVAKFCKKGSLVGVDGRLQQRSYDRKDGTKANVLEVIADSVQFLEPKGTTTDESANAEVNQVAEDTTETNNTETLDIVDDDLPF